MSLKDEYFASMVSRFKRWDAEFSMLGEKGVQTGEAMNKRFDAQCREMRLTRDAAYRKLQEIRTASESAWRGMQSNVDAAWISMRNALEDASARSNKRS